MKPSLLCMSAAACIMLASACGKKSPQTTGTEKESHALVGKWKVVKAEGPVSSLNEGVFYHFELNQLTVSEGGFANPGKITVKDSLFSWTPNGASVTFDYRYRMDGNQLIVQMMNSDQVFYLEKAE